MMGENMVIFISTVRDSKGHSLSLLLILPMLTPPHSPPHTNTASHL